MDASIGIEWAIKSLNTKQIAGKSTDSLEYRIIKLLSERTVGKSAFLHTLYIQRASIGQLVQPPKPFYGRGDRDRGEMMQVDEAGASEAQQPHQPQLDLTLTKRLFGQLHPDALTIPTPVVPSNGDFEREYSGILAEQEQIISGILLKALISTDCSKQLSDALVSVLRNLTPRAAPFISAIAVPADA